MRLVLFCLAVVSLLLAGPAAADDSALNKEGFWTVGRGDAEAEACMASIGGRDTPMLLIQIAPGHIDFVVGAAKPMRKGKLGVLTVGDQRFEFVPNYSDRRDMMFLEDVGGRALAAMRKARWVSVMVDGRELVSVNLENTGVEGALDATAACTEGKSGWWGEGVRAAAPKVAAHKDGVWQVSAGEAPGVCMASANIDDDHTFTIFGEEGAMAFGVGSDKGMRRGRKGRMEIDGYVFDFTPTYDSANFFYSEDLESQAAFVLRRAKRARISMDGKPLVELVFEGSGYPDVLGDLADCAQGKPGWWGAGAKAR